MAKKRRAIKVGPGTEWRCLLTPSGKIRLGNIMGRGSIRVACSEKGRCSLTISDTVKEYGVWRDRGGERTSMVARTVAQNYIDLYADKKTCKMAAGSEWI